MDPMYPIEDWKCDVAWNRTRLGYEDWRDMMAEAAEDEPPFDQYDPLGTALEWRREVMLKGTRLGYNDWIEERRDAEYRPARLASRLRGSVPSPKIGENFAK